MQTGNNKNNNKTQTNKNKQRNKKQTKNKKQTNKNNHNTILKATRKSRLGGNVNNYTYSNSSLSWNGEEWRK